MSSEVLLRLCFEEDPSNDEDFAKAVLIRYGGVGCGSVERGGAK